MKIALIGGNNYAAIHAVRSALESLPPNTTVIVTSNYGVCKPAAAVAAELHLPVEKVLWKCHPYRIVPFCDGVIVFYDGAGFDAINDLFKSLTHNHKPYRVYGPIGTVVRNLLDFSRFPCITETKKEKRNGGRSPKQTKGRHSGWSPSDAA